MSITVNRLRSRESILLGVRKGIRMNINLVEDFHEREFFDTGQSGQIEPIVLFSALKIISLVLNGLERNSSQSKILR